MKCQIEAEFFSLNLLTDKDAASQIDLPEGENRTPIVFTFSGSLNNENAKKLLSSLPFIPVMEFNREERKIGPISDALARAESIFEDLHHGEIDVNQAQEAIYPILVELDLEPEQ